MVLLKLRAEYTSGLKETKELDLREPFRDFIESHCFEDAGDYEEAVAEFMDVETFQFLHDVQQVGECEKPAVLG